MCSHFRTAEFIGVLWTLGLYRGLYLVNVDSVADDKTARRRKDKTARLAWGGFLDKLPPRRTI